MVIMSMKGIDVSNWQKGIDLTKVPCDFVVVKATEGNYYISEDFERQTEQVIKSGKKLGFYHYANGGDVKEEAEFFINNIKEYIGQGLLVLDWEGGGNPLFGKNDFNWCKAWCDHVANKTGVRPIIYIQASAIKNVTGAGCAGLWVAQYADMNPTGYQETPWNEGAYECLIRQYSSTGRLNGYSGNLDLNKAYIDAGQWDKLAGKKETPKVKTPTGSTLDLVVGTLQGKFGNGDARKVNLGTRYDEVQTFINKVSYADTNTLVKEVLQGKYGNGEVRKIVLGSRYNEVQNAINKQSQQPAAVYYTVKSGDNLSTIASRYGTTVSKITQLNKLANPHLIYPRQTFRVK